MGPVDSRSKGPIAEADMMSLKPEKRFSLFLEHGAQGSIMGRVWSPRLVGARPGRALPTQSKVDPLKEFTQGGNMIIFTVWEDYLASGVKNRLKSGLSLNGS